MGKSTISMAIFNCYVSSPEGNHVTIGQWVTSPCFDEFREAESLVSFARKLAQHGMAKAAKAAKGEDGRHQGRAPEVLVLSKSHEKPLKTHW